MLATLGGGEREGGGMFFNKKSTDIQQDLHKVKLALNAFREDLKTLKSDNSRQLLEFAELGEKMRRTYLRLSRIVKIDSKGSSEPEEENNGEPEPKMDPRAIRDQIERSF